MGVAEPLAGVAHMGPVTHPDEVNARIAGHLQAVSTLPIAA